MYTIIVKNQTRRYDTIQFVKLIYKFISWIITYVKQIITLNLIMYFISYKVDLTFKERSGSYYYPSN